MSAQTVYCERCSTVHGVSTYHSPDSHRELDRNSLISNLEWRVVEAAIKWRQDMNFADESHETIESFAAGSMFKDTVDALIAAREAELKEE